MRNHVVTTGIVLARTDYQEADRILTILTPDQGKVRAMAKGVRKARSKLAGGIELFSVSELTLLPTRGELQTLISTRLLIHYGTIVKDIRRTMLGYELIKRVNRVTEDAAGEEFFVLLQQTLVGLNVPELDLELLELWFAMQLLSITGHTPNMKTDTEGKPLIASEQYLFEFDEMAYRQQAGGPFTANHIKLMRLAYAADSPLILVQVKDTGTITTDMLNLATNMVKVNLRI